MATPLSVQLTADISKLEAELKKAKKRLQDFEKGVETSSVKTEKGFDKVGKGAKKAGSSIDDFAASSLASVVSVAALSSVFIALLPKIKEFALNLSDSQKALQSLNLETAKSIGAVQGEIAVLNALLKIARDETRSKEERQRSINKINELYKDYLPNLNLENINNKKVTESVDKLTASLIRQAKIRGAQALISKEVTKILEIQAETALESLTILDALAAGFKSYGNFGSTSANLVTAGLERQNKETAEAEKRIASLTTLLQALTDEDVSSKGIFSSSKSVKGGAASSSPLFETSIPGLGGASVPGSQGPIFGPVFAEAKMELSTFQRALQTFDADVSGILSNVFNNLGAALINGGNFLESLGSTILGALGGFLSRLGEQFILYGSSVIAFSAATKALSNPLTAGPAGAALIAIGAVLSTVGGAISQAGANGFSGSGSGSGGISGQGSQSFSGSTSVTRSGGFGDGEVVFKIAGRSLIGVLNRELKNKNKTISDVI